MKDPQRDVYMAGEAARVLDSEFVKYVLDAMEARCIAEWVSTKPEEADKREEIYAKHSGVKAFRSELTALVNRGSMAANQVEEERVRETHGLTGHRNLLPTQ